MIVVIGSDKDVHAAHVLQALEARGVACCYLDTLTFPSMMRISLTPAGPGMGWMTTPDGRNVALEDITAIYWRYFNGIIVADGVPEEITPIVRREIDSALGSMFRNMPRALWVNPPTAIERHKFKTYQLKLMADAGIPIPDTLVTNDPDALKAFYDKHNGNVIYKPVAGGAHTERVTPDDLKPDRLAHLATSPVQFQECIEGVDVRVYVVGDDMFTAEIRAKTLDFRSDPKAAIVPVALPPQVAEQCRRVADLFEYRFTGIDIRRTPDGRHVFLEGNPSPMFVYFEQHSGYPITESLIKLLLSGGS